MASPPKVPRFIKYVKWITLKLVCIVLFLIVLIVGNWYVYDYVQNKDTYERCSSDYPDLGVILDNVVTLDDGSVQTGDGTVYPPGAFWVEDGLVRGCPCVIRPCVQRCCPPGQFINRQKNRIRCGHSDISNEGINTNDILQVASGNDPLQRVTVRRNHYFVTSKSHQGCYFLAIPSNTDYILLDNGRIWDKISSTYVVHSLCFNVSDGLLIDTSPWQCDDPRDFTKTKLFFVFKYAFLIIPMMLHVVTFVVFLLVPRLRGGSGLAIMNYVAAQFLKALALLYVNTNKDITYLENGIGGRWLNSKMLTGMVYLSKGEREPLSERHPSVYIASMVQYYFELSAHVWQLVIAFQIRSAFSCRQIPRTEHNSRIRTILYSCVAWGVSLVWMVMLPHIREILNNSFPGSIYLVTGIKLLTLVVTEVVILVLCVITACSLRAHQKDSARLQGPDSQRHNTAVIKWFNLFLKLSFIMGVDYIFLNMFDLIDNLLIWRTIYTRKYLSQFIVPMFVRTTLQNINQLRGLEIFFIFVFKMEVWTYLQKRFCLRNRK